MAPLFKIRAPASGGGGVVGNKIDITGYGSSDVSGNNNKPSSPSFYSQDVSEKFGKIRRSKGLNVHYLPKLIAALVLFIVYSMHSAKYSSGSIIKDVSNNHAFGIVQSAATSSGSTEEEEEGGGEAAAAAATTGVVGPLLLDEKQLAEKVDLLDKQVREYKPKEGMFMENDPGALALTKELQDWTKSLVLARYGNHLAYRVALDLEYPASITDLDDNNKETTGRVVFEMAPLNLLPCSVYNFMEIARTFQRGAFIRNAAHVLQASVTSQVKKSMPFQEYSEDHPHKKGTTGYAGRPSGPQFYISIMNNTRAHGRGTQQKKNPYEADSNFGHVVEGMEDAVPRIHSVPQKEFLDKANYVKITSMTILYTDEVDGNGEWKEWKAATTSSSSTTS